MFDFNSINSNRRVPSFLSETIYTDAKMFQHEIVYPATLLWAAPIIVLVKKDGVYQTFLCGLSVAEWCQWMILTPCHLSVEHLVPWMVATVLQPQIYQGVIGKERCSFVQDIVFGWFHLVSECTKNIRQAGEFHPVVVVDIWLNCHEHFCEVSGW